MKKHENKLETTAQSPKLVNAARGFKKSTDNGKSNEWIYLYTSNHPLYRLVVPNCVARS